MENVMRLWKKLDETSEEDLNCPNCGANLLFVMDANGEVWVTVPCESCDWEPRQKQSNGGWNKKWKQTGRK